MKAFSFLFFCLPLMSAVGLVQDVSKDAVQVLGPAQCQDYGAVLDVVAQNARADLPIIVIARLGKEETRSELNRRRLHNVRTYWIEFHSDKRPFESVILAEGERVNDHGRIEIYVGGRLTTVLKVKKNFDLILGNCYPEPLGAPHCSVKENRNFYPCLDVSRKKSR
jgi:hypothetical protein